MHSGTLTLDNLIVGFLHCISETYKKKQLDGDDNIQSMAALKWTTAEFRVVSK